MPILASLTGFAGGLWPWAARGTGLLAQARPAARLISGAGACLYVVAQALPHLLTLLRAEREARWAQEIGLREALLLRTHAAALAVGELDAAVRQELAGPEG